MIYQVIHRTRYSYGKPVDLGAHMLHLQPRVLPWQTVLSKSLRAEPAPADLRHGQDGFGNDVAWMFLDTPHPSFEVTLHATVGVTARASPEPGDTPPWEAVAGQAYAGGAGAYEAAEFLFDSPMAARIEEVAAYAAKSFPPGRKILPALLDFNTRIGKDFAFKGGVTGVNTTIKQVMQQRAGVCQDFSHLMIAGLRSLGLPARYVSGYIRTKPPPGQKRRRGADMSHAWVGCWLGPEHGWIDLDPTNNLIVADEHVILGWGRDYADISPICGVLLGGGRHTLSVSVDLEPVGEE